MAELPDRFISGGLKKMGSSPKLLPIIAACLVLYQETIGAEFVIDVPQLHGIHGTAPYTAVDVKVQLPTTYSQIDAASLRLTGEHFPGSTVSVIGNQGGPISAVLQLENAPPNLPYDFYPYPYFSHALPLDLLQFDIEILIQSPYQPTSDFRNWLDGSAEFTFFAGPPLINGTFAYSSYPLIAIERAELVVVGEPLGVPEPASIVLGVPRVSARRQPPGGNPGLRCATASR